MSTSTNTHALTAWFANKGEHVAFKHVGQERRALVAQLERGEAVTVTFEQSTGPGKPTITRQVTLTGVAGHTFTSKPTPSFPEGKPVVLCTFAESDQERASRVSQTKRAAAPNKPASKSAQVVAQPAQPAQDLTSLAAAMRAAGFSAAEVLAALAAQDVATITANAQPVANVTNVAKRERTPAQIAATERMLAAKAAKAGTPQPVAKPAPVAPVAPVVVAQPAQPAPVGTKVPKVCGACQVVAPVLYRTTLSDVKVCGECACMETAELAAALGVTAA